MSKIIDQCEAYVRQLYENKKDAKLSYHSLSHLKRTIKNAQLIAENSGLPEEEFEVLLLSSWLHDCGIFEQDKGHEEKSIEIAKHFLESRNYPQDKMESVFGCIHATNPLNKPQNLTEKILYDANLLHLGKKNYFKRNKELRKELKNARGISFTKEDWIKLNIQFFNENEFQTEFARATYGDQRLLNLSTLQESIQRSKSMDKKQDSILSDDPDSLQKKIKRTKTPDRGVETMFRLTSKNHFTLSSIADNKASTLISISALIISIILSVLVRRLQEDPYLIFPTVVILITLMGTIIFAVLATRPKITSSTLSREDITQRKGNLLFFGNFINMPVEDYEWGIKELMGDRDYLYNNLIRDIYYLGLVLDKKYRYLRIAYNIFMYGLIVSVIAYIIAFAL